MKQTRPQTREELFFENKKLRQAQTSLAADVSKLVEVLRFYADSRNYGNHGTYDYSTPIDNDSGHKAREVIDEVLPWLALERWRK